MAITSGFFDSVNGDRTYDADQMSNYFDGLVSDGVYETIGDRFLVTASSGMTVNVGSGRAIIQSRWVKNDATATLTLDPSDVQLNRVDAIVLRLDTTARSITLDVKKGTAVSGTPTMPAITRTQSVYELYLASVYVAKGATQPTSITDLRPSSYCGWVTGVVQQVDTSDLFVQWQTAYNQMIAFINEKTYQFDLWFESLTQRLTVEAGFVKLQSISRMPARPDNYLGCEIGIGIDEYDPNEDALLVFLNGVFLSEGYDYEQTSGNIGNAITIQRAIPASSSAKMTFIVFKNIIGKNVLLPDTAALLTEPVLSANIPENITDYEPIGEG